MNKKNRKAEGKHDWDGSCMPGCNGCYGFTQVSFSVGIFKWVRGSTKNIKRGPVVYRIKGSINTPDKVYERAEYVCDCMDDGTWKRQYHTIGGAIVKIRSEVVK